MVEMLKDKSGDAFDMSYLKIMIQHHKSGVMMAKLAGEKAEQAQLKDLGRKIISAQNKEIDQMSGWLSEEKMSKEMAMLEKAKGAEFDKMFLQHMAMHHEEAIAMSKMASGNAKHPEAKELADKIVKDQSKENEQITAMLR